jgi:hypothetical protein
MSLKELIDDTLTDKNTCHSYLETYENLFNPIKDSAKHILEIGVGDFTVKNGGSLKLWRDYFKNAIIHGVDIMGPERVLDYLLRDNRIVIHNYTDGYDKGNLNKISANNSIKFDVIIDDGTHSLHDMIKVIQLYSDLLTENGILIIEDVQDISWVETLKESVPDELKNCIQIVDLRHIKNRWDDILLIVNKNKLV